MYGDMMGSRIISKIRQLAKVKRGFRFYFLKLRNVESKVLRFIMSEAFKEEAQHSSIYLHVNKKEEIKNFLAICKSATPQKLEYFKLQYWRPPPEG